MIEQQLQIVAKLIHNREPIVCRMLRAGKQSKVNIVAMDAPKVYYCLSLSFRSGFGLSSGFRDGLAFSGGAGCVRGWTRGAGCDGRSLYAGGR